MAKPAVRLRVVEVAVFLGLLLLLGRAAQVQLLQGRRWAEEAGGGGGGGGGGGAGASGLEKALDSLLAGRPGAAVVLKDRAGRAYESPARVIAQPVAGRDVVLTLDRELQEIAQRALDDALRRMDAEGGDVVMLDPATGEVLAIASRRPPSAFTDPFEPGP